MAIPKFNTVISLSNTQISEAIVQAEKELFSLRFKKSYPTAFQIS